MTAASMGGAGDVEAPDPPVTPPDSGFYAPFGPLFAVLIQAARTATVRMIQNVEVRANPHLPPTLTSRSYDEITAYVSGPKPKRGADDALRSVSEIKIIAAFDTLAAPPDIDQQVEFDGDKYVVTEVKRLPLTGSGVAWKIMAQRGG